MTEHLRRISGRSMMLVVLVIGVAAYAARPILLPFVAAGVLAFVCTPLVNWISSRTGIWRALAAAVVFISVLAIVGAFGYLALPRVVSEALTVVSNLQEIIQSAIAGVIGDQPVSILGQIVNPQELAQRTVESIRNWIGQPERLLTIAGLSFVSMFGMILTVVLFAYMLFDGPGIERGLLWLVPPQQRSFARHLWERVEPALRRYFVGLAVVVLYTSAAAYIGLAIFLHLPHAVLLAIATGFLELIPFIGPLAAAVLAGMIALQNAHGIESVVAYALYASALRLSIDQIVGPVVLGTAARIHPALVIFCLLVGGYLFGVIGIVLAIPVAVTIKITLAALYEPLTNEDDAGH